MRVVVTIQARLSSQRLPGKILRNLRGRPMLDYLLEGLGHATRVDEVWIATSAEASDDATAEFAAARGVRCHRGPLEDVARRLLGAGEAAAADAIVRVSGDSPLLDPALVDEAVALYRESTVDVVSNVRPRSFPKGQSVEVIAMAALRRAVAQMRAVEEREHVTPYLYAHPEKFAVRAIGAMQPRPDVQLSVDSPEDFARCEAILGLLAAPHWQAGWRGCVAAYDQSAASARVAAGS
jgi:spore coat polysaccharide biosynthesis protein SpsF (cytidylyltransferase family)